MKRFLLLLSLISVLLTACDNAAFNSDGVSLVYARSYSDGALEDGWLRLSTHLDKDDTYSLILRSPDGSLEWTSPLASEDGMYISAELAITRGAVFPSGEYTWFITSTTGKELTGTVTLGYDSSPSLPEAGNIGEGDSVSWYDEEGGAAEGLADAFYAVISSHDSYGNPLTVRETI